jgi:hypothetical protein
MEHGVSVLLGVCIIVALIPATIILPVIVGKVVWEALDRWLP